MGLPSQVLAAALLLTTLHCHLCWAAAAQPVAPVSTAASDAPRPSVNAVGNTGEGPAASQLQLTDIDAVDISGKRMAVLSFPTSLLPAIRNAISSNAVLEMGGTLYALSLPTDPVLRLTQVVLKPIGPVATIAGVPQKVSTDTEPEGGGFGSAWRAIGQPVGAASLTPSESGSALTITATSLTGDATPAIVLIGSTADVALKATLDASKPNIRRPGLPPTVPAAKVPPKLPPATGNATRTPPTPSTPTTAPKGKDAAGAQPPGSLTSDDAITILHWNDWHNRMEPCTQPWHELCDAPGADLRHCSGGLARMKKWLDDSRAKYGKNVLTLNAGDDFIGTVWDRKYGVDQAAHFLSLLKPNASTVGNHEWDWGTNKLTDYLSMVNHHVLGSCNLEIPSGHKLGQQLQQYVSYNMLNAKVCVFGLATRDVMADKTQPVKVLDPYWYGKQCVYKMQKDGCQVIILLSHLGYTADIVAAQLTPGLDLVVGGHSHSLLWNGKAPLWDKDAGKSDNVWGSYPTWVDSKVDKGRKVPVVQAGWGSRYMGTVRLHIKPPSQRKPGESVVSKVEGWPAMLGGTGSDSPYDEDSSVVQDIRKWRYWKN